MFKYTFDKGERHSTEKANKKAKYSRSILNSQKTYSVRIVRIYTNNNTDEKRHRADTK